MSEIKKENWFKRAGRGIARYFRELRSELKKVAWPTPQQVLKNTIIVLVCVLIVGAFVSMIDIVARYGIDNLISACRGA